MKYFWLGLDIGACLLGIGAAGFAAGLLLQLPAYLHGALKDRRWRRRELVGKGICPHCNRRP